MLYPTDEFGAKVPVYVLTPDGDIVPEEPPEVRLTLQLLVCLSSGEWSARATAISNRMNSDDKGPVPGWGPALSFEELD